MYTGEVTKHECYFVSKFDGTKVRDNMYTFDSHQHNNVTELADLGCEVKILKSESRLGNEDGKILGPILTSS